MAGDTDFLLELPQGWSSSKLGAVADVTKLAGYEFTEYVEYDDSGEIMALRALNVIDGRLDLTSVKRITKAVSDALPRSKLHKNDILLTYTGSIGQVAVIDKQDKYHLAPNVCRLRVNGEVNVRFVFSFLRSSIFKQQLSSFTVGSTQPTIPMKSIREIALPIPPLAEQKAIASILGALDDKIELNRRMNATLEAMARALFQSWFVDFDPVRAKLDGRKPEGMDKATAALFPDSFEESEAGQIPKGWTIVKIHDCCVQIQNVGTPRRNEPRFWDGGNIPWLASGEVRQSIITATEGFITEDGLAESSAKWVPAFSTVVALYGATAGQVSFISSRLTTNQAVCALIPKKDFAFFNYLTMRCATNEMENKAVGSAQQNISKGIVEETQVVLPPITLVERFAELANPLFDRWISNLHQSRTLATLRDTLLPKLLSGELSVAHSTITKGDKL